MNYYERDAHSAVGLAHDALETALRLCEEVGFSDMNVLGPLRDALTATISALATIEGKT